jgi:hypothetical protein
MIRQAVLLTLGAACAVTAATATAQERDRRTSAKNESERLICRRVQDTSSLVRTHRQCFTRAEWDRIAEATQRGAGRTISGLAGGYNGNE